jgi:nucleoside-diphosphate-sugar epimerase
VRGRVLVVGGTRGVGAIIAERLIDKGYAVGVLARDPVAARARHGSRVEIVEGDVTRPETLPPAVAGAHHIVFTAGVPSGRYAPEHLVRATDYQGARETIAAALDARMGGRFVYLNSIGVTVPSVSAVLLNLLKRNVLTWRRRLEDEIRRSGLDYTIIRVGFLIDASGRHRAVRVAQQALPLTPWHRIARADDTESTQAP